MHCSPIWHKICCFYKFIPMKFVKYWAWIGILALGTTAVTLGSFPVVFRYSFVAFFAFLLFSARTIPTLQKYCRILDVFFIIALIRILPSLTYYKMFHSAGREFFYQRRSFIPRPSVWTNSPVRFRIFFVVSISLVFANPHALLRSSGNMIPRNYSV